jgi:hypothetical protein
MQRDKDNAPRRRRRATQTACACATCPLREAPATWLSKDGGVSLGAGVTAMFCCKRQMLVAGDDSGNVMLGWEARTLSRKRDAGVVVNARKARRDGELFAVSCC